MTVGGNIERPLSDMLCSKKFLLILLLLVASCAGHLTPETPIAVSDIEENSSAGIEVPEISVPVYFQALTANNWIILDTRDLWRTADGGKTWARVYRSSTSGERRTSQGLNFYDANNGYAVLEGRFLKTADGGMTWTAISDCKFGAESIFFLNETVGFAAGSEAGPGIRDNFGFYEVGRVWKTEDGGITWNKLNVPPPKPLVESGYHKWDIRDVHFTDDSTGWIAGRSTLYRTNDGGRNWFPIDFGGALDARSIQFINQDLGWVHAGGIFVTNNAGIDWQELELPRSMAYEHASLLITTDGTALFLSEHGRLYSADDLKNWKEVPQSNTRWMEIVEFGHNGHAYSSTAFDGSSVFIWLPFDGGKPLGIMSHVRKP